MSTNINSQNYDTNNPQAAWPLSKKSRAGKSRYIEAPQYLPKYSITQALEQKDEFRSMLNDINLKSKKRKKVFQTLKKILLIALAGLGISYLYKKY